MRLCSLPWHDNWPMQRARLGLFLPLLVAATLAGSFGNIAQANGQIGSLVCVLAVGLGLLMCLSAPQRPATTSDRLLAIVLSSLFLLPGTQLAWLLLLLSGLWLGWRDRDILEVRRGGLLIALAALQPMLQTYLLKWFAAPLLSLDAWMVGGLLALTTGTGELSGNLIYGPSGHPLLLLRGCSSFTSIGQACLAWFALSRYCGPLGRRIDLGMILLLLFGLVLINLFRLSTMALDVRWHQWWHAENGTFAYQLLIQGFTLGSVALGLLYGKRYG